MNDSIRRELRLTTIVDLAEADRFEMLAPFTKTRKVRIDRIFVSQTLGLSEGEPEAKVSGLIVYKASKNEHRDDFRLWPAARAEAPPVVDGVFALHAVRWRTVLAVAAEWDS